MFTKDQTNAPAQRVVLVLEGNSGTQLLTREVDKAARFGKHYGRQRGDRHLTYPLRLKDSMLAMEWKDECPATASLTNSALFDMVWRKYLIYVTDRVTALALLRTGQPGHGRMWERRVRQATYLAG